MEEKTLTDLVQDAVHALNEIIFSDELTDSKAVLKIIRFKKWLKNIEQ